MPSEYIIDMQLKNNIKHLNKKVNKIINKYEEITVLDEYYYEFQPYGETYVWILGESHFIIHTNPEHLSINLNLFSCKDKLPERTIKGLIDFFNPIRIRKRIIRRNIELNSD